jgi:riboflavin synthase
LAERWARRAETLQALAFTGSGRIVFTGLIQDVGSIYKITKAEGLYRLWIRTALNLEDFQPGESVAVNGICLTVVDSDEDRFLLEISPETLSRTALGEVRPGRRVNLELALRLSDRLGGHIVTGHIDGVGRVRRRQSGPGHLELEVGIEPRLGPYLVEKGSVAVDGISLTTNRCGADWFALTLIPHTIERTTLVEKRIGDRVNVECDILGKYVERFLRARSAGDPKGGKITEDYLREHGFT